MDTPSSAKHDSMIGLLTRMYWMGLGPIFLILLLMNVVMTGSGWLTTTDVLYLLGLGSLPLVRRIELRLGIAQTADGQSATDSDLRNYTAFAMLIGLVAWVAANVVGNHVLGG